MSLNLQISTNESIYIRDPQATKLGKSILHHSVELMYEQSFEDFNFKKLAESMNSTEASVYRYFNNKYQLFTYMTALFWEWQMFRFLLHTSNIEDPNEKIKVALNLLVDGDRDNTLFQMLDNLKLHHIMIEQGSKIYHTSFTDEDNQKGFFLSYKKYSNTLADIIIEINPDYKYPHALATSIIESAFSQIYYAHHLPRLTDFAKDAKPEKSICDMLIHMVDKVLR